MAKRLIPRKTKVKIELIKGITISDLIVAAIGVGGTIALAVSNLSIAGQAVNLYFALGFAVLIALMFMPIEEGLRLYASLGLLIRFIAFKKKYSKSDVDKKNGRLKIKDIIPFEKITKDKFIDFQEYYGMVIEIKPIEFGLLNDYKQEMVIRNFANVLRRMSNSQSASIIKLNKAIVFDDYITYEDKKI